MKKPSPQCKIGKTKVPPAKAKKAIEHWESLRGRKDAGFTFVGSLPAPPEGMMRMYCMGAWMNAYYTAARIDADMLALPVLIQSYNSCVAQHTV
jgi:hypothetical protein